jgi:hypothetical protein
MQHDLALHVIHRAHIHVSLAMEELLYGCGLVDNLTQSARVTLAKTFFDWTKFIFKNGLTKGCTIPDGTDYYSPL